MCWVLRFEHQWNCCKETNEPGTVLPCKTACEATQDCQDPTSIYRESVWPPMADGMITSQCAKCNNLGYYQLSSPPLRVLYGGPYEPSDYFGPFFSTTDYYLFCTNQRQPFHPGPGSRERASRSTHIEEPTEYFCQNAEHNFCPSCQARKRRDSVAMRSLETRVEELERALKGGEGGKPNQ